MAKRSATIIAAMIAAALLFAACGDDGDATSDERPEDIGDIGTDDGTAPTVAPTPTAVPATVEPERLTYTVVEGDLMGSIAQMFDVPLGALVAVNDMDDPNFIQVGDELVIPTDDEVAEWEAAEAASQADDSTGAAEGDSSTSSEAEPTADSATGSDG